MRRTMLPRSVHRVRCLLLGHEWLTQATPHRLWLLCDRCGYETSGWSIDRPPIRPNPGPPMVPHADASANELAGRL